MSETKQISKSGAAAPLPGPGIKLADVYYVLFRQKWLIIGFFAAGLIAGAIVYLTQSTLYWSEAKLLFRSIIDSKPLETAMGPTSSARSSDYAGDISSEI